MGKEQVGFKNRDRFIRLGITIAALCRMRGMSQEQLAEKAGLSRSHLSAIEAPNMIRGMSTETFFNICDALGVEASALIEASLFPDKILHGTDSQPSAKRKQ